MSRFSNHSAREPRNSEVAGGDTRWGPVGATALLVAALAGLYGCGGDGPTGTDDGNGSGSNAEVSGTWEFRSSGGSASLFSSGSASVTSTLQLTVNGGSLTGSHSNTVRRSNFCSDFGGCFYSSSRIPRGEVQGSVSGQSVVLQFNTDGDSELERYEGTVSGDRIEGDGWSAEKGEAPPPPLSAPVAPTNLTATVDGQALEALLQWIDNSSDEDGFAIAETCDGPSNWSLLGLVDPGTTRVNITGFVSGKSCSYIVLAFKAAGDEAVLSDPSNVITVNMP